MEVFLLPTVSPKPSWFKDQCISSVCTQALCLTSEPSVPSLDFNESRSFDDTIDMDYSKKIFKPARAKSAPPGGIETKALTTDTGIAFLSGYNTRSVLGYCRWLVSTQCECLCTIAPYTSHFVCKNVLGHSSACWGIPKAFCWVQPGFSSLFFNKWSQF